jgi:uncharacterized protein YjiS (DUF1127 family)
VAVYPTPAVDAASAWLSHLLASLHRTAALWVARSRRSREGKVLHAFSDRELRDLDLNRFDVQSTINGSYRRD